MKVAVVAYVLGPDKSEFEEMKYNIDAEPLAGQKFEKFIAFLEEREWPHLVRVYEGLSNRDVVRDMRTNAKYDLYYSIVYGGKNNEVLWRFFKDRKGCVVVYRRKGDIWDEMIEDEAKCREYKSHRKGDRIEVEGESGEFIRVAPPISRIDGDIKVAYFVIPDEEWDPPEDSGGISGLLFLGVLGAVALLPLIVAKWKNIQ